MTGKVDLAASILELALKDSSMKSIQEKLKLSPSDFGEQLRMLELKALIDVSISKKKVKVTKRGAKFLDLYNSIRVRYLSVQA